MFIPCYILIEGEMHRRAANRDVMKLPARQVLERATLAAAAAEARDTWFAALACRLWITNMTVFEESRVY